MLKTYSTMMSFLEILQIHQKKALISIKKLECLKSVIGSGKAYYFGRKWTQEDVNKANNETINKTYDACKQRELNEKGEKTEKALGKHVINLYSIQCLRWLRSRMLKNYGRILRMSRSLKIRWLT